MPINNLTWNRVRYNFYAPFYNAIKLIVAKLRQQSIAQLQLQRGDKVLIIGVGTGLNLDYLPRGVEVTAVDLSPLMISRATARAERLAVNFVGEVMDAGNLKLPDDSYDAVILQPCFRKPSLSACG